MNLKFAGGGRIRTRNLQGMSLMSFSNNYSTPLLLFQWLVIRAVFRTGLGPCLPNNLSTYGARRFHISRSEWDRVFSRLTVVPGLS